MQYINDHFNKFILEKDLQGSTLVENQLKYTSYKFKSRVRTLKSWLARLKARVGRLKLRVGRLKARVRRLKIPSSKC